MERKYTYNKKINRTYLVLFIIIFGSFFLFSLSETLASSKALTDYENNAIETIEENEYSPWDSEKNQLEKKYQFNLTITIVTILLASIVFFAIFYSRSKLEIDDEGIYILGITGKNYTEKYRWETIDFIEIAYTQGLGSVFFQKALIIHQDSKGSISIPVEGFVNGKEIIEEIQSNNLVRLMPREDFEVQQCSILELFKETVRHLKSNYMTYVSFSLIIMVFTGLNRIFYNSPINLITTIATFYFGIKANVAMNIFSFESLNNNHLSFNDTWEKTKGKFWRYYSSLLVQGLFQIPFILIALYIYNASGNVFFKGVMFSLFGLLYSATVLWLFLIPYIASITTSKKSYFSLNSSLLKGVYKKLWPLVLFELIRVAVLIVFFINYDLFLPIQQLNQLMLMSITVDFIKLPFYSVYIMKLIHEAPFLEAGENNEIEEAV